jgi:tetratricopeptide (TPR) repeat protein
VLQKGWMTYYIALAALALAPFATAADPRWELAAKAQSAFDSVQLSTVPRLEQTGACVQAQAELLAIATPEEAPLVHYHKGYCALAGAVLTHEPAEFRAAAAEFDKAIETWPERARVLSKKKPPEPVSSGLRALAWIARLEAGVDTPALARAQSELAMAEETRACPSVVMQAAFCEASLQTGRVWLGWIALRRGDLYEANKYLSAAQGSGWRSWAAGKMAFRESRYAEAVQEYRQALDAWARARQAATPSLSDRLMPQPDTGEALADLAGAQILAGDPAGAVATLDTALKTDPNYARALYLRGRAKQALGHTEAAIADYNLAGRAAFAAATNLASGEAHLYRGIALYLRKDYTRAEDEFSSAINFEIPDSLKPDAQAWRDMAAVAGGACSETPARLERDLETTSPFFPKQEARKLAFSCGEERTAKALTTTDAAAQ